MNPNKVWNPFSFRLAIFSTSFGTPTSGHVFCPLPGNSVGSWQRTGFPPDRWNSFYLRSRISRDQEMTELKTKFWIHRYSRSAAESCHNQTVTRRVQSLCHGYRACRFFSRTSIFFIKWTSLPASQPTHSPSLCPPASACTSPSKPPLPASTNLSSNQNLSTGWPRPRPQQPRQPRPHDRQRQLDRQGRVCLEAGKSFQRGSGILTTRVLECKPNLLSRNQSRRRSRPRWSTSTTPRREGMRRQILRR